LLQSGPLSGPVSQKRRIAIGMAINVAARKARRGVLGTTAALTEVAARPTPSNTSAHDPEGTRLAVMRTNVAVVIPATPMNIRAAMPAGWVAQPSIA